MTNQIQAILEERGNRYGAYSSHAAITQAIKEALKAGQSYKNLSPHQAETLDMIAHKLGRIVNGDVDYLDSWVDIVGYTQLTIDIMNENEISHP